MNTQHTLLDRSIESVARFAIRGGTAIALTAAIFFAHAGPDLGMTRAQARGTASADVVRLEPVAVTVSAATFDAVRAEAQRPSLLARVFGRKAHAA